MVFFIKIPLRSKSSAKFVLCILILRSILLLTLSSSISVCIVFPLFWFLKGWELGETVKGIHNSQDNRKFRKKYLFFLNVINFYLSIHLKKNCWKNCFKYEPVSIMNSYYFIWKINVINYLSILSLYNRDKLIFGGLQAYVS